MVRRNLKLFLIVIFAITGVSLTGMLIYGIDMRKKPNVGSVDTRWKVVGTEQGVPLTVSG